jgi:hypothetical protein
MDETFERLDSYRNALRECLAVLDGAAPEDPVVGRAFEELDGHFAALGDLGALRRAAQGADAARLTAELEELTRLNAILVAAVSRDQERLLELLQNSQRARRSCKSVAGQDRTGVSCDVQG